jgi:hypothetical protein
VFCASLCADRASNQHPVPLLRRRRRRLEKNNHSNKKASLHILAWVSDADGHERRRKPARSQRDNGAQISEQQVSCLTFSSLQDL